MSDDFLFDFNDTPPQPDSPARTDKAAWELVDTFRREIGAAGLGYPEIIPDGTLTRFNVPGDKPNSKNGWAILYMEDGAAAGAFGTWRGDFRQTWSSFEGREGTEAQREAWRAKMEQARRAREEARAERQREVAAEVNQLFSTCNYATTHPYLDRKKVAPHGLATDGRDLLIPVMDVEGRVWSAQRITAAGEKLFETGGRVQGCCYWIEGSTDRIFIAEGYATAATIHEATGNKVYIAFQCGNLAATLKIARQHYPLTPIVIAADNDQFTKGNPGLTKAKEAVETDPNTRVVYPTFKDLEGKPTDFNDLHIMCGKDALIVQLGGTGSYRIETFEYFLNNEFPGRPLISGLMESANALLLVGDSNVGKSLLTMNLALHIGMEAGVMGSALPALWGRYTVDQTVRTLFVQSENDSRSLKKRISCMIRSEPCFRTALKNIHTECYGTDSRVTGEFTDPAFMSRLSAIVDNHGIELVIFDPLISYHGQDENDNAAMRRSLDRVTKFMGQTGAAVCIVHHRGKDGSKGGRGASAIRDWCDAELIAELAEKENPFRVKVTPDKLRGEGSFTPFYLERDDGLVFRLASGEDSQGEGGTYRERLTAIVDALARAGRPLSVAQLGEALDISERTLFRVLSRAVKDGSLEQGGTRKERVYSLPASGADDVNF